MLRATLAIVTFTLAVQPSPLLAQISGPLPNSLEGVDVLEHAGDALPLAVKFRDHRDRHVTLGQFFQDRKPVILTLNYSNCPMLCNLQLTGLIDALRELELEAGRDFQVVSVSIDPLETTTRAAQTHQRYLQQYGRPGTGDGFHFLVGKQTDIQQVADAVGFQYRYLRERREYSHPAVFVMATPDGRISHYVYGVTFEPKTLKFALVEAGQGQIGSAWDRVLLYCLHYDSTTGRYSAAVWKLMRLGGIATLITLGCVLGGYFRRDWRNRSREPAMTILQGSAAKNPDRIASAEPDSSGV